LIVIRSHPDFARRTSALDIRIYFVWHINKNRTQNTKQHFTTNDEYQEFLQSWNQLIYSTTEDDYSNWLAEIEKQYPLPPIRYVKETWLIYREKFIVAWTQIYLHLVNSATSRVEGSHAFLKRHMCCIWRYINCIQRGNFSGAWQPILAFLSASSLPSMPVCPETRFTCTVPDCTPGALGWCGHVRAAS